MLNAGMESREVLELLRRQPSRRGEQPSLLIHPIVWLGTLIARSGVQITLRGTLTTMLVIAVIAFLALQGALAVGRLPTILAPRSEERRGGKGCVRTGRSRWSPYP